MMMMMMMMHGIEYGLVFVWNVFRLKLPNGFG